MSSSGQVEASAWMKPGRVPSYYLENEQQYDALLDFRRKLREAAESGAGLKTR